MSRFAPSRRPCPDLRSMRLKEPIVRALLYCYPARWREEYGPELADVLHTRPFSVWTVVDVALSGLRERLRNPQPATIAGCVGMAFVVNAIAANIADPSSSRMLALLADSTKTLPTMVVKPVESDLYAFFLMAWGCWTALRTRGTPSASGRAAVRITFIATLPIVVMGLLMMAGLLAVKVGTYGSGSVGAFSYAGARLAPWAVALAPFFALPKVWLFGLTGGFVGRRIGGLR